MSKKINKAEVKHEGVPIPLYIPNIMGYVRFFAIILSWKYAMNDPYTFTILYATSYMLGAIDGTVARLFGQTSFFGAQLDILMSRFAT
jgi:CDP-diacylglycerol--inositol 3-phosphatidyltransferase